jgi:transcriptional regulator with XRE-family HTH domain
VDLTRKPHLNELSFPTFKSTRDRATKVSDEKSGRTFQPPDHLRHTAHSLVSRAIRIRPTPPNVIIGNTIRHRKARTRRSSNPMDTHLSKPADPSTTDLGRRVRAARQAQDLTLETASRLCGVSRSTLSKVENGLMSPTFDVLQKIVLGLKIEIGELFGSTPKVSASGRRALTRKNEGQRHAYRGYQMELLATDLAHKAMLPFRIRISAHTLDAFDDWGRHEGEEFLYVISGSVCLYSELYAPTHLNAGDSLYFDSRTGHAAVSTSDEDAEVLWMATSADIPQPPVTVESTKK